MENAIRRLGIGGELELMAFEWKLDQKDHAV